MGRKGGERAILRMSKDISGLRRALRRVELYLRRVGTVTSWNRCSCRAARRRSPEAWIWSAVGDRPEE